MATRQTSTDNRKRQRLIRVLKASLSFLPLLGLTWVFGLVAAFDSGVVLQYVPCMHAIIYIIPFA